MENIIYKKDSKVNPCPKCGAEGIVMITWDTEQVVCTKCDCKTRKYYGDYYDEGCMNGCFVIPKWNKGNVL